jgi:ATP-dependent Clp protease protease subunit
LNRIFSRHTGQPLERVEKDSDRDFFMSPEEAKEYGLVDEVIYYRDLAKRVPDLPIMPTTVPATS